MTLLLVTYVLTCASRTNPNPDPNQDIYMNEMRLDEPDLILDIILQVSQ